MPLNDALIANTLRHTVARLRTFLEVADQSLLSVRNRFPLISTWRRIGSSPIERAPSSSDPWNLIGERIRWLVPTDWLSVPIDAGGWFTVRSHQGFAALRRALEYPTKDIFLIQGSHACAVMDEEHGLELFDSSMTA